MTTMMMIMIILTMIMMTMMIITMMIMITTMIIIMITGVLLPLWDSTVRVENQKDRLRDILFV